ncbi:aminotransferase class IV [Thalassotalea sp. G2M2-11]|uniref:aminotransferase class IV n=1 Tax=Thalassotalea sp. G2M2-11 TaxID=2787627 RepID=UPI0019D0FB86|nr:aminotransferase class IV [Thalassotalea sp. G2M2-11]
MSIVYLNGEFIPPEQAKISPMDRGFLFGDGIYEVIPSYDNKFVGFTPHIDRLLDGLAAIEINHPYDHAFFEEICHQLCEQNGGGDLGIYIHVSRGADTKRHHAFTQNIRPTLFAYAFEIPPAPCVDDTKINTYKVISAQDLRWQRCNIKSTSLLGNVMHYQRSHQAGFDETLLFNEKDELTEAASCNCFIVKDGVVITPKLDHQKLPGITRLLILDILDKYSDIPVEERVVTRDEVFAADEIWLTSSTKQVGPVRQLDDKIINNGNLGDIWRQTQALFTAHQFDYNDY